MKIIFNLLIFGSVLLLTGCHDITVGYLFTDEAEYSPNELEITNIYVRLAELKANLKIFTEKAGPLQDEYNRLNAEFLALQTKMDSLNGIINPKLDSIDRILDPVKDALKIEELEKQLATVYYPQRKELTARYDEAQGKVHNAELKLQKLADELGIKSSTITAGEITDLENRISYKVPWVTAEMIGIKGTEPLVYEIVEIKNESAENAAAFGNYLKIVGAGQMWVDQDFDVPAGRYVITVKVSNEGRSKVFTDAFTFVVRRPVVAESY